MGTFFDYAIFKIVTNNTKLIRNQRSIDRNHINHCFFSINTVLFLTILKTALSKKVSHSPVSFLWLVLSVTRFNIFENFCLVWKCSWYKMNIIRNQSKILTGRLRIIHLYVVVDNFIFWFWESRIETFSSFSVNYRKNFKRYVSS